MPTVDPLHIPAADRREDMDYQWFGLLNGRNPEATGWQAVARDEMPGFPSDSPTTIDCGEMRLYRRPLALTERVRRQEQAVAQELVHLADSAVARLLRGETAPRVPRRVARALSSPLGPHGRRRTVRGVLIWLLVWLRHQLGWRPSPDLVGRFCRVGPVGMRRWAEENQVTLDQYVRLHNEAILEGRGRWLGQIIYAARR